MGILSSKEKRNATINDWWFSDLDTSTSDEDITTTKKQKVVYSEQKQNGTYLENFTKIEKQMTEEDIKLIVQSLKKSFIFYNLHESEYEQIITTMFYAKTNKKEFVLN